MWVNLVATMVMIAGIFASYSTWPNTWVRSAA
jgi:hypothetical protein